MKKTRRHRRAEEAESVDHVADYALDQDARSAQSERLLTDLDLRVFDKPTTLKMLGLSDRTWDRMEARGETPSRVLLSPNRVGYRASDLKQWLDQRQRRGGQAIAA